MIRLILILMIAATTVSAQESKRFITTQPCDPFEKMFETLNKYEEQLLFTSNGIQFSAQDGNPYSGRSFFFVNQDTGTWSHVIIYGDGMACMVANGTDFEPYTSAQPSKDNL
jgi:hypothetical protein